MSLLSTSSKPGQEAYLYENHYPQPIVIEPNSQICLQKFIHYRGALYEVTVQNNTIGFRFGTGGQNQDVPRFVAIPIGSYEGGQLATALALALNSVNQQQNYLWTVNFIVAPSTNDFDKFQITYTSVPTPAANSGQYNLFSSGQLSVTGQDEEGKQAKLTYNGTNADHFATVISKRSTLVLLGEQTWSDIQPSHHTEVFQPFQCGLVRNQLSNPADPNPNLQFKPGRYDLAFECEGTGMAITYGRQRSGSTVGNENWFQSDVRRDLAPLFTFLFLANGGVFNKQMKIQLKMTIFATAQSTRRVLVQMFKKDVGETEYTALGNGDGGNSLITGTALVKTANNTGALSFPGTIFDSGDETLNDTGTPIAQHYPQLSKAPFFPTTTFQKTGNLILTGYDLDFDTWTNVAGGVTSTFTELVANTNGYNWSVATNVGNVLQGTYWQQIDAITFHIKGGDVPMTVPPLYVATLDPVGGTINPNGQIEVRDGITNALVQTINFDGASPVPEETSRLSVLTDGIFNGIEPLPGLGAGEVEEEVGGESSLVGADLASNARLFLRGSGGGTEADVANLLGFSQNEDDLGTGQAPQTGGSTTSDQEPDQTANNNTLHISIPEMPLVKSYEGENSAEAKSVAIIPREEFATGDQVGSLVYVAPFENWIDINNGQELNMNLLTTIVRNADGGLAENLVRETQAVFKIRQDPMKLEEEKKAERFREMAEMMANTINTGLTTLISPQQLIGS